MRKRDQKYADDANFFVVSKKEQKTTKSCHTSTEKAKITSEPNNNIGYEFKKYSNLQKIEKIGTIFKRNHKISGTRQVKRPPRVKESVQFRQV